MNCVPFARVNQYRSIVSEIKDGIISNNLSKVKTATAHLHKCPHLIPQTLAQLNALTSNGQLMFRWLPQSDHSCAKLLIRNYSTGLSVNAINNMASDGLTVSDCQNRIFLPLRPELALAYLSKYAQRAFRDRKKSKQFKRHIGSSNIAQLVTTK